MGFLERLFRRDKSTGGTASPTAGGDNPDATSSRQRREYVLQSLADRYPGQEGMRLKVSDGVLEDVLAYRVDEPVGGALPHWHFITRGLSDLSASQGIELTMRLATDLSDPAAVPPTWPVDLLSFLADYVGSYGHPILPGHHVDLQSPFVPDSEEYAEPLIAAVFFPDPSLTSSNTKPSTVVYNQLIGVTARDLQDALNWHTDKFIELFQQAYPLGVTVKDRASLRGNQLAAAAIDEGIAADGSSTSHGFADRLALEYTDGRLHIILGPIAVDSVVAAQRTRLTFDREFTLIGERRTVRFFASQVTPAASLDHDGNALVEITREVANEIRARLTPEPGTYELSSTNVTFHVNPDG